MTWSVGVDSSAKGWNDLGLRFETDTPPSILVVDDMPNNIDLLRAQLAVQGYTVLRPRTGRKLYSR